MDFVMCFGLMFILGSKTHKLSISILQERDPHIKRKVVFVGYLEKNP